MRTKIKIVGLGDRRKGVSPKNNRAYDFVPVSFVYEDKFMNGLKAATSNIGGEMLDAVGGVKLNEEREIFYHTYNNAVVVDGIL